MLKWSIELLSWVQNLYHFLCLVLYSEVAQNTASFQNRASFGASPRVLCDKHCNQRGRNARRYPRRVGVAFHRETMPKTLADDLNFKDAKLDKILNNPYFLHSATEV